MAQSSGPTIPTFVKALLVLTIVTGSMTVVGSGYTTWESDKIEYSTEALDRPCEPRYSDNNETESTNTQSDSRNVLSYDNLSTEAQEIFRSAVQADDEYTTRILPDEFVLQTDTTNANYVQYNSECYRLTAQSKRETPLLYAFILRTIGGGLTAIFAITTVISLVWTTIQQRSGST